MDGLEQASIGRLANAMQMSKSGLYSYFTSKQDLQLATIDYAWRIFEELVLEPGDAPLDALLERWISYYEQDVFAGGCPFITAGTEFANRDGPVHDALATAIEHQRAALEHAVARDHASRLLTDTDPRQLAFELHALLVASSQDFRISREAGAFGHARAAIARLLSGDPPRLQPLRADGRPPHPTAPLGAGSNESPRSPTARRAPGTRGGARGEGVPRTDVHRVQIASELLGLDHVALAVADPGAMQAFLCDYLGMKELGHSASGIAVGACGDATKLALIPSDGPREAAALARVVLRVADVERAVAALPAGTEVQEDAPDLVTFEGPETLRLGFALVAGGGIDYDVDHVVLHVAEPEDTRFSLAELGCVPQGDTLRIADKHIRLEELPAWSERPLLDHLGIRVGSTDAIASGARARGLEIGEPATQDRVTIVLPGLERIRLDFVARAAAL